MLIKGCHTIVESQDLIFIETRGTSMRPLLRGGEKIVVKKVAVQDLRIGDIICYKVHDRTFCHRIINKQKAAACAGACLLWLRGDNCYALPEIIDAEQYIGKVVGIICNKRLISVSNWRLRCLGIAMAMLYPFGIELIKIIMAFRTKCSTYCRIFAKMFGTQ